VSDSVREQNLARHAVEARLVQERALYWSLRYAGSVRESDLADAGNFALLDVVRSYLDEHGPFKTYCRYRLDRAMLNEIRVEKRHLRLHRAACRAQADLLALYRWDDADASLDRLADDVAAATFVAVTQEAMRGGDDEAAAREAYATAHAIVRAVLEILPVPVRRAVGLLYVEGLTQEAAAQELGVHVNTIQNWQRKGFAKIKEQLALNYDADPRAAPRGRSRCGVCP
jgi:RNA polymerase sigma factor (sigma-70 family)